MDDIKLGIQKIFRKLFKRPHIYLAHLFLIVSFYIIAKWSSLSVEYVNVVSLVLFSILSAVTLILYMREISPLRISILKTATRFSVYLLIGLFAGSLYLIANQPSLDANFAEQLQRVAGAALISAVVIPAIKEVIDLLFEFQGRQVLKEEKHHLLLEQFGIISITRDWRELAKPSDVSRTFPSLCKEFIHESQWFLVTINPKGFMESLFNETLVEALKHDSKVHWAYLKVPKEDEDKGVSKLLNDWWITRYDASMGTATNREARIESTRKNVQNNVDMLENLLDSFVANKTIKEEQFNLYENYLPTTYLAALALRTSKPASAILENKLIDDIPGLLLVHPYQMWHASDKRMYGMVLSNPGELYEQYALSILRFFTPAPEYKYLKQIWPRNTKNGKLDTPSSSLYNPTLPA